MISILKQVLEKLSRLEKELPVLDMPTISGKIGLLQITCERIKHGINQLKINPHASVVSTSKKRKVFNYLYQFKQISTTSLISLSLICIIGYFVKHEKLERYKSLTRKLQINDLKYRVLKTSSNKTLKNTLRTVDSLYEASPEILIDSVKRADKLYLK